MAPFSDPVDRELPRPGVVFGARSGRTLLFLPGFLVGPAAYRSLLTPVGEAGVRVLVPALRGRGPGALMGRPSPAEESVLAAGMALELVAAGEEVWLGGHSRGGLVAWLAGEGVDHAGLVLVDPVAGGGGPWIRAASVPSAPTPVPRLVIGASLGGRCAPEGRNHELFARAATAVRHVVVPDSGHADVLDGWEQRLGGVLCGAGPDPGRARAAISDLLVRFLDDPGRVSASR